MSAVLNDINKNNMTFIEENIGNLTKSIIVSHMDDLIRFTDVDKYLYKNNKTQLNDLLNDVYKESSQTNYNDYIRFFLPDDSLFLQFYPSGKKTEIDSNTELHLDKVKSDKEGFYGLRSGSKHNSYHYIKPIFYDGEYAGAVEMGIFINKEWIHYLKQFMGNKAEFVYIPVKNGNMVVEEAITTLDSITIPDKILVSGSKVLNSSNDDFIELSTQNSMYGLLNTPLYENESIIGFFGIMRDITFIGERKAHGGRLIIFVSLSEMLILIIIAVFIFRKMFSPINVLIEKAKSISEGEADLTSYLNINRKDELGKLSQYFNRFIDKLKDLVINIKDVSRNSKTISDELSSNVEETNTQVEEMVNNIEHIKNESIVLNHNIKSSSESLDFVTKGIKDLTDKINEQASLVEESSSSIEEMISSIESISKITSEKKSSTEKLLEVTQEGGEYVNKTNKIIEDVSQNIDDMLKTIDIINNISSQTNLLAMNASIEAAHAGDAGKGFAVVADEIRNLSESTAVNAKTISDSLKKIINMIELALQASEDSGVSFENISKEVKLVSDALTEISGGMNELSAGSNQIMKAITNLSNITTEVRESSIEMDKGSGKIRVSVGKLQETADRVNQNIAEFATGTQQITQATGEVSILTNKNKDKINTLNEEISKFNTEDVENKNKAILTTNIDEV
jgi:methyl-accepting chemotaxis protein